MRRWRLEIERRSKNSAIAEYEVYWRALQTRINEDDEAPSLTEIGEFWRGTDGGALARPSVLPELRISSAVARILKAIDQSNVAELSRTETVLAELMQPLKAFEARSDFAPAAATPFQLWMRRFFPLRRSLRRVEEAWLARYHDRIALLRSLAGCAAFETAFALEKSGEGEERDIDWYRTRAEAAFAVWPHEAYPIITAARIAVERRKYLLATDLGARALAIEDTLPNVRNYLSTVTLPALAFLSLSDAAQDAYDLSLEALAERMRAGIKVAAQHAVKAQVFTSASIEDAEQNDWTRFELLLTKPDITWNTQSAPEQEITGGHKTSEAQEQELSALWVIFWFALALCNRATVLWQANAGSNAISPSFATATHMLEVVSIRVARLRAEGAPADRDLGLVAGRDAAAAAAARLFLARELDEDDTKPIRAFETLLDSLHNLNDAELNIGLDVIKNRTSTHFDEINKGLDDKDESRLSLFVPRLEDRITDGLVTNVAPPMLVYASEAYAPWEEAQSRIAKRVEDVLDRLGLTDLGSERFVPFVLKLGPEHDAVDGGRYVIDDGGGAVEDETVALHREEPLPKEPSVHRLRIWPSDTDMLEATSFGLSSQMPRLLRPPPTSQDTDQFEAAIKMWDSGRPLADGDAWLDFVSARAAHHALTRLSDHVTIDGALSLLVSKEEAKVANAKQSALLFALLRLLIRDRTPIHDIKDAIGAMSPLPEDLPAWRLNALVRAYPKVLLQLWGNRTPMQSIVLDGDCPIALPSDLPLVGARRIARALNSRLDTAMDERPDLRRDAVRLIVRSNASREVLARALAQSGYSVPVLTLGEAQDVDPQALQNPVEDFWDALP